jgi:hypothetical protein
VVCGKNSFGESTRTWTIQFRDAYSRSHQFQCNLAVNSSPPHLTCGSAVAKIPFAQIVCSVLGGFITLFGLVSYLFKEKFYLSEARM